MKKLFFSSLYFKHRAYGAINGELKRLPLKNKACENDYSLDESVENEKERHNPGNFVRKLKTKKNDGIWHN